MSADESQSPTQNPVSASHRVEPFERGERRLMVSLGPLHHKRYCTYRCPFCYVNAQYESFGRHSIEQIVAWARAQDPASYDTVYVSGDTDSFAPPRLDAGLSLLECLASLDKDLLFTTRAPFDEHAIERLSRLAQRLRASGHWLFGCVSIAQFTVPHLEPPPIPDPPTRARLLTEFHNHGLVSVLALRPFLPNVPLTDYARILDCCDGGADIVLGEDWYADLDGTLELAVLRGVSVDVEPVVETMPFDSNNARWRVYKLARHEEFVREECRRRALPFFMRSGPALALWRATSRPTQ